LKLIRVARKLLRSKNNRDFLLQLMPKNSVCAEIGVHLGDFSERILNIVEPKKLYLIDPWKFEDSEVYNKSLYGRESGKNQENMDARFEKVCNKFKNSVNNQVVVINRGYSSDILKIFDDDYFDWLYIDGNHQYEFVKNDLELSISKVKKGGYIAGDDYGEGMWWKGGVKKAVDEFAKQENVKILKVKNNQFILEKTK